MKTTEETMALLIGAKASPANATMMEGSVSPRSRQMVMQLLPGQYKHLMLETVSGHALCFVIEKINPDKEVLQTVELNAAQQFSTPSFAFPVLLKVQNNDWHAQGDYVLRLS